MNWWIYGIGVVWTLLWTVLWAILIQCKQADRRRSTILHNLYVEKQMRKLREMRNNMGVDE